MENLNNSLANGEAIVSSIFLHSTIVFVNSLLLTNFKTAGFGVCFCVN